MQTINGVEVEHDVLHFFHLVNRIAYTYKNMWAMEIIIELMRMKGTWHMQPMIVGVMHI
jgi:hypothetical protein